MTGASVNSLSKARMRRLLAAVGSVPSQDRTVGEVRPYDWRDPHWLNADQTSRLTAAMGQIATKLGGVFTRFFNCKFKVSLTAATPHFAGDLYRLIDMDRLHCLTFGPEDQPSCGFLAIPSGTTIDWVTRLLGDADAAGDPDRSLSSLEESLLSDLMTAVIEAFVAPMRSHEVLQSSGRLSKGQPPIQFEPTEEICRITFLVKQADKDDEVNITFVLSCGPLAALAGKAPKSTAQPTPDELSRTLLEHLQQMPVTVTARLATVPVGFQEVLDLGSGDILLLDKQVHDMVELVIEGRTVSFRGHPVQSKGQYAILIRESQAGPAQETPASNPPAESKKGKNSNT